MPAHVPNAGLNRRDLLKRAGGLAALAAFTAACGGNTGRPSGGGGGGGSKATLAQWYHQYGETGTKEAALKYAKAYPDANIAVEWTPGDYGSKLASGLLSSKGPDVFESQLNIGMVKSNQVVALDDIIADVKDDFAPGDLATNTVDGKVYGIRMIVDPQVIYYRKSMLDKAGIKPPETLDDLVAAAKELTTDKVKGIFVGNDGGNALGGPAVFASGGSLLTEDNKVGFTGARSAQALSKLRQMYADKSVLLGAPTDWWDPGAINQGLVAMQWIGMWAVPGMQKALGDDLGVFAFPKADAEGKAAVYSGGWTQFVSAKSANVDAAKKFVKWLWIDQAEYQEDWSLNYGFHIPPRKSIAAKASKLQSGVAAETVKLTTEFGYTDNPAWTPKMGTAFTDVLTNVIKKGADPAAEFSKAEKTVNGELARLFG
ncbi:sugar ABC transporter substrate-binding protein [Kribbella sandramycini]|uniref:Multiple sugar transport system substrate-binding protein n=1 Tax=Kribbella sandramycini TaxID=60450 RepID=A0A7Y4P0J3_9ACTN|nr:sugar ABC transporter substrate-binding protein [Kribbella sandramycini]MBB6569022.1 multiple sugar transport system substrate-binding protein [Kribbella sandramycini]NOL41134.1 sugar ABC transporter substrate-binding protein [Kribbella sandramycini]